MDHRPCDACHRPLTPTWHHNSLGRVWCTHHAGWPQCAWCGLPTRDVVHGEYACGLCTSDVVTTERQAHPVIRNVAIAMAAEGVGLTMDFTVVLEERATLQRKGYFKEDTTTGLTRSRTESGTGRVVSVTVALIKGMPKLQFTSTFAHEFGHMYLAGAKKTSPQWVFEGFSEVLAYRYLTRHDKTPAALRRANQLRRNSDPVYGGGLRRMLLVVDRHGLPRVAQTLRAGRPSEVELP